MSPILSSVGTALARYLSLPNPRYRPLATSDPRALAAALEPGDVLLVEGNTRFSTAIKYLTQSTWSHAALYVGDAIDSSGGTSDSPVLVEVDVVEGVITAPLEKYAGMHTRICRPIGLTPDDCEKVVNYVLARLGQHYDLRNIIDLVRYLVPVPPVPIRWRRRMLVLGSGDPTRAICSTLIAQAFQSVRYPILPNVVRQAAPTPDCNDCVEEVLNIRHHSLFVPRDFDISPYFAIVKPTIARGFDYHALVWGDVGRADRSSQ